MTKEEFDQHSEERRKTELEEVFLSDLRALMRKHHVNSIVAEDHYQEYPECGEDIRMTAKLHRKGEYIYIEIDMGKGFYAED